MKKGKSSNAGIKAFCYGRYATSVYLPLSTLSRHWRNLSRKIRGETAKLHETRLPEVSWRAFCEDGARPVWEAEKKDGNVRISELGILSSLAAQCEKGTDLFEIGTFDGRTTLNLAMNSSVECHVHTLDLPPDTPTQFEIEKGEVHMVDKSCSGSRYEKYRAKFPNTIKKISQLFGDSGSFDFSTFTDSCSLVFVDGSHAYEYAISDTVAARAMVRAGGVIVWHDYGVWKGVTKALEQIEAHEGLGLRNIRGTSLVIWKRNSKDENNNLPSE